MEEIFKWNEEYNCEVSNMGYILREDGTISYPSLRADGYYIIKDGRGRTVRIHRLVAKTFLDNPSYLTDVNHKDGDKSHNSVDNLEWCDRGFNIKHAYDTGLREIKRGADSPNTKLTLEDAQYIYDHYQTDGYNSNTKELAEQFGLTPQSIRTIIRGVTSNGKPIWEDVVRDRDFPANNRGGISSGREKLSRVTPNIANNMMGIARKVAQVDLKTGEILKTFNSANDATKQTGITHIGDVALGKRHSSGGYGWKYLDE